MANNSHSGRSDQLSSAERGQGRPSLDDTPSAQERTALLGNQRPGTQSGGGVNNSNSNNNSSNINKRLKRSLSGNGRKKIIVSLTSLSGVLLVILAVALFKKIGAVPTVEKNTPNLIKAKHGAVASEEVHCSEIGVEDLSLFAVL
ncbi:hypothetical protein EDD21DRAFT_406963 [Dissophora ornata]|nr:hypothetical protein EDD21DRAFT_406963 [Dissophora ornata]